MKYIIICLTIVSLSMSEASETNSVIAEVAKLRQKYEECKAGQISAKSVDVSRYNATVAELAQQKAVIDSLEKTLQSRDRRYRELLNENEKLKIESHSAKVSRIERQNLTSSLEKAKTEVERLKAIIGNSKTTSKTIVQEKIVEKVVYKERPVIQEKIITKTVEPTEKIIALERELANAQAKLTNLKNSPSNTVVKEKIVEKVVYKDRPVVQAKVVEKVVYKDRPVVQEKIVEKVVYKDRPVVQEKRVEQNVKPLKAPETKTAMVHTEKPLVNGKKSLSHAYRIWGNAPIYNAPGGTQVDTWEDRRSFTAGNPSNGWVHISGYFVNRVWQSTAENESLWVRESDTIRR